ncbi:MAG: DUF5615 family PIN-like protein [Acidobacteria bacterium]|nr:DUF5615 family PIN-like protein [Acidobacteriota bacterium]
MADADLNHKILVGLRRREPAVDFLSAIEGGVIGLPDSEVLRVASGLGRILVSHDRKTMPRHFSSLVDRQASPGLIILSQDLEIGTAIDELLLVWLATDAQEWIGQVGFLPV